MASKDLTHMNGNQSRGEQEKISEEDKVNHDYNRLILSLPRENGPLTQNVFEFYFFHSRFLSRAFFFLPKISFVWILLSGFNC